MTKQSFKLGNVVKSAVASPAGFRSNLRSVVALAAICLTGFTFFASCGEPPEPPPANEAIELKSPITENTTLKDLGLPIDYFYAGDNFLQVKNGAILTIEDSVTIQFTKTNGGIEIIDGATIKALGTANKRIQFVGGATKGSWSRIWVKTEKDNIFNYVDFINGGSQTHTTNRYGVFALDNAKASISHCKILGGLADGIVMWDKCNITAFDNNIVENVDRAPVYMRNEFSKLSKFDMTSTFTNNTNKYIEVEGSQFIREDVTLNKTSVPYYFTYGPNITDEKRLTINEGVTIYMGENIGITNYNGTGKLTINGSIANPVTFTRLPGTSYHWNLINFEGGTGHIINNCVLEYGGAKPATNQENCILKINAAQITLNNVIIRNSLARGVVVDNFGGAPSISATNVTFANNGDCNVYVFRPVEGCYNSFEEMP